MSRYSRRMATDARGFDSPAPLKRHFVRPT